MQVDYTKCNACGMCIPICPGECIEIVDDGVAEYARINEDECISCEQCVDACEWGAISE